MKPITRFLADDGSEFGSEESCRSYESVCADIRAIMARLPAIPDLPSCEFANGAGYIQHDPMTAREAQNDLLRIARQIMPHKWFDETLANNAHPSWAGRLISEMNNRALYSAWQRFMCMSADFKEYGQPYYATHQDEAKNVCFATGEPA